jgi:hypothetical protein
VSSFSDRLTRDVLASNAASYAGVL